MNCEFGGVRLDAGPDTDDDGELGDAEVEASSYACFDAPGDGADLLSTSEYVGAATAACPGGYVRVAMGYDVDDDGELDPTEARATSVSCNLLPRLANPGTLILGPCSADFEFEGFAIDPDGTVASRTVRVLRSWSPLAFTVEPGGALALAAGAHKGVAELAVALVDDQGASATYEVSVVFEGEGCLPVDNFYGVDPSTCIEFDVNDFAGDDRGGITLTPTGILYNGDDALIRADRDLRNVEVVVEDDADTLLHDNATGELYSLWSSEFEFDSVLTADGALRGCCDRSFDQLAQLDEETVSVVSSITLVPEVPIAGARISVDLGTGAADARVDRVLIALRGDRFVAAIAGYTLEGSDDFRLLRVYDSATGTLLDEHIDSSGEEGFYDLQWITQEVSLHHVPLFLADGTEFLVWQTFGTNVWVRVDARTGEATESTDTFASDCDLAVVSLDETGLYAYSHAEGGCWTTDAYVSESIARCDVLTLPNDGSVDDTGEQGGGE